MCKLDKWIPVSYPSPLKVKPTHEEDVFWVSRLMSDNLSSWNIQRLKANFKDDEVQNILAIPVSVIRPPDKLIWHYSRNENDTISSGYGVAVEFVRTLSTMV